MCNRVVVIEDNEVAEEGAYDELVSGGAFPLVLCHITDPSTHHHDHFFILVTFNFIFSTLLSPLISWIPCT